MQTAVPCTFTHLPSRCAIVFASLLRIGSFEKPNSLSLTPNSDNIWSIRNCQFVIWVIHMGSYFNFLLNMYEYLHSYFCIEHNFTYFLKCYLANNPKLLHIILFHSFFSKHWIISHTHQLNISNITSLKLLICHNSSFFVIMYHMWISILLLHQMRWHL